MPDLSFFSDLLLILATIGVALYVHALGRRVRKMADLDKGLGPAVAALSDHVDKLSSLHTEIRDATQAETSQLRDLTAQADDRIGRMELLVASLDDLDRSQATGPARGDTPGLPHFRRADRALAQEELT